MSDFNPETQRSECDHLRDQLERVEQRERDARALALALRSRLSEFRVTCDVFAAQIVVTGQSEHNPAIFIVTRAEIDAFRDTIKRIWERVTP